MVLGLDVSLEMRQCHPEALQLSETLLQLTLQLQNPRHTHTRTFTRAHNTRYKSLFLVEHLGINRKLLGGGKKPKRIHVHVGFISIILPYTYG